MSRHERQVPRSTATPRQARSRQMRADLLDGATRVLASRGGEGFTTNHVAEATGASIGSLYQYFPNKGALLAALHDREAISLWCDLEYVLDDVARPARERFEEVMLRTCRAQHAAAELQRALRDVGVAVDETADFPALETRVVERFATFLRDVAGMEHGEAERCAAYALLVIKAILERIPHERDPAEVDRLAEVTTMILADYLELPA